MSDFDAEAIAVDADDAEAAAAAQAAAEPRWRAALSETEGAHFRWADIVLLASGVAATVLGLLGWLATSETIGLFFSLLGLALVMAAMFGPLRRQLSACMDSAELREDT